MRKMQANFISAMRLNPTSTLVLKRLFTKRRFSLVLGFAGALIHSSLGLAAQKLDALEILENTLELYGSAGYYSCQASISESVEIYVNDPTQEQGYDTSSTEFSHQVALQYTRPAQYSAFWTIVDANAESVRTGSITTALDIFILAHQYPQKPELTEEPDQYDSLNQAIDYSEFSSKRFTTLLREFLEPSFHDDLLTNEIKLVGTKKLAKRRCYVLRLEGYKDMRIWVDRTNFALVQIEYSLTQDTLLNEVAWLDWKRSQAQLALDSDESRIDRRINLYNDAKLSRPNRFTLTFQSQSIQP